MGRGARTEGPWKRWVTANRCGSCDGDRLGCLDPPQLPTSHYLFYGWNDLLLPTILKLSGNNKASAHSSSEIRRILGIASTAKCVPVASRPYSRWPLARSAALPRISSSSCHEVGPSLPAA